MSVCVWLYDVVPVFGALAYISLGLTGLCVAYLLFCHPLLYVPGSGCEVQSDAEESCPECRVDRRRLSKFCMSIDKLGSLHGHRQLLATQRYDNYPYIRLCKADFSVFGHNPVCALQFYRQERVSDGQ